MKTASTKHTPGPWTIERDHPYWNIIAGNALVAETMMDHPEDVHNARLIAAAPELLNALQLHIAFLDSLPKGWLGGTCADIGLLNQAYLASSAAIAKATKKGQP